MSSTIKANIRTFKTLAEKILGAKLPLMLRGPHGIGKSECVYQLGVKMSLPIVERRAAQLSEGDLLGLPTKKELPNGSQVTSFLPPDWLQECVTDARLLFLDEVDRAQLEIRQGIFQLTNSRS